MFAYLFLKALVFIHGKHWQFSSTPMGYWYLVEVIGFVGIPLYLYVEGVRRRDIPVIRTAAILTAVGIILNRLNISIIAYKWDAPVHYYPSWIEIEITLAIIFAEIWAFRWVVNRMPVLRKSPEWVVEEH
jgi:Ni/Fe-hydrogenase subunit HybB-like protein